MGKYIDADKLIAEIERLFAEHSSKYGMDEAAIVLDKLENFINSLQQEQPEENKLPNKRARVNYAICKLQTFKPLREAIVLDGYFYDEGKCCRENLLNYIKAIPESRLTEIRSYLKEKGWWPYDDDTDWMEQEQQGLPGIEESGIPGKDYIPVEWVDACERYGKWEIVKKEKPEVNFKIKERKWVHDAVDNIFPEDGDFMSEVDFIKILKDTASHFYELGKNSK